MKKFVFAAIAVLAVTAITLSLNAQPAGGMGGDMGGFGGGAGGGMMGGGAGMMGGGMRGARGPIVRPDKAARLALIKELEAQVKTLVAAVEAAPAKDTEVTAESDQATTDKATAERQAETDALAAVQATLASLKNAAAPAAGGRGGRGGASADVLSELRVLANGEKATKTVAKLDALIKEAQTTGGARGGRGQGGMMGGGAGGMMGGGAGGMMGGGAGAGAGAGRGGRGGAGGV